MEVQTKSQAFQVYLRLRPPVAANQLYSALPSPNRFLTVEEPYEDAPPTHITLNPPNDNRRRAVEKFAFTKVFEEDASQVDIFQGTGVLPLVEGVLGANGANGRDGLLATLGVTGSGKSHTILGSRNQRGLTQMALDVLFRSISSNILDVNTTPSRHSGIAPSDPSEAQVLSAQIFLDTIYGDPSGPSRASSRAQTPMIVRPPHNPITEAPHMPGSFPSASYQSSDSGSPKSIRIVQAEDDSILQSPLSSLIPTTSSFFPSFMQSTAAAARKYITKTPTKGESYQPAPTPRRNLLQRPSVLPQLPDISNVRVDADTNAEYAILISMYEVYNDRIFDLLTPPMPTKSIKDFKRRPLLFKPTEQSPDRKVVAGLRKIICSTLTEALMVLEAGLHERRVAGTGSNSVSSRSHGFFCVEVKKRRRSRAPGQWGGSALTIVDLAGSERARDAKTQGATLAEAGKINESLMYLGQCLQMVSETSTKLNLVPFRQCKLTELLFSNSFPSITSSYSHTHHRNPQKAVMIVTADPLGDFNATSQILRYSALAREITVPRIPSVSSTILASGTYNNNPCTSRPGGRSTPTDTERETMEIAALEIARMSEEIDGLRNELSYEQQRRMEAESHLLSMEDRLIELEQEIRESCYEEMERRMNAEISRWKAGFEEEKEWKDEHLDKKVDILMRGVGVDKQDGELGGEDENKENERGAEGVREENERLKREVEVLRREVAARSPSKKMPLKERGSRVGMNHGVALDGLERSMGSLGLNGADTDGEGDSEITLAKEKGSPMKKVRKITGGKWDVRVEGEEEGDEVDLL